MLRMALRQAVELNSYERAARNFSELTNVSISASSLQRLVMEYGTEVVIADEKEAEAMVRVPEEEEGVAWRRIADPDSEVMVVSADGVMVHLRDEGWKEAKVASVSAAPVCEAGQKAERELRLEKHSYRAGSMGCEALHQPLLGRELSSRGGKGQTGRLHQRWRYLDLDDGLRLFFPAASKFSTGGTCSNTSGRLQPKRWVPTQPRPLPGLIPRKPPCLVANTAFSSVASCVSILSSLRRLQRSKGLSPICGKIDDA